MSAFRVIRVTAALAAALAAAPALAGGPLANCSPGRPYLWAAGGSAIPFNPDQGSLGPLSHAQAVGAVKESFDTWGAVPTTSARYVQGAELPVDVDISNFGPWLDPVAPDGLSAIVFDDTGEIFDLIFGPGSGVLGFAGPEWGDPSTCTITEGVSFLNGPSFDDLVAAKDVMVHEFGHYTNLAHTAVNGQIFLGDNTGPTPFDTFGPPPSITVIETMYPFYFGPGSGFSTPHADDIAAISTLYPSAAFAATTGAISGTILASNGMTRLSGVNVIARNVASPFLDAVSAMSGDRTDGAAQDDPLVGTYRLNGLTPGASYAVYVDQILEGGFSTPPIALPGPEEFASGAAESDNVTSPDDPGTFAPVAVAAGAVASGVNVIFNGFRPGDPLPVGDDGNVELPLPFPFKLCGQQFDAVFVNANGNLTFGAPGPEFSETVGRFLAGPPRIAGVWDDLDASAGGIVTFQQDTGSFTASWTDVPEFISGGSNSFSITLKKKENSATLQYGSLTALDGLAGLSCGGKVTSGFENETALSSRSGRRTIELGRDAAAFEIFTELDDNLSNQRVTFTELKDGFRDSFRNNHDVAHAVPVRPPFDSARFLFTQVDAEGADFYRFRAKAGDILAIEVVRGAFDSTLGVFDADTGELLIADDDGGGGLLSRLLLQANVDLNLAVAVSSYPDLAFTTGGDESGRYGLGIRSYRGEILDAGDDTSNVVALPLGFKFAGQTWASVFVNSNGNLTFGAGSADFTETAPELLAGPPRIAPLWDDLDASTGLVIAEQAPLYTRIHYVSVPEFFSDAGNYFSVGLGKGGAVEVDWGATARSDALVGRSVGNGAADPGETNLSARFLPLFGGPTVYERFLAPDPFDLNYGVILFVPSP